MLHLKNLLSKSNILHVNRLPQKTANLCWMRCNMPPCEMQFNTFGILYTCPHLISLFTGIFLPHRRRKSHIVVNFAVNCAFRPNILSIRHACFSSWKIRRDMKLSGRAWGYVFTIAAACLGQNSPKHALPTHSLVHTADPEISWKTWSGASSYGSS